MFNTLKIKWRFYLKLFTVVLSPILYGQSEYEPGYIILNTNDTIYGTIKDRADGKLFNKLRFRKENKKTKKYSPYDIKGYEKGTFSFESIWYKEETEFFRFDYFNREGYGEKVFLKVLAKGRLSCYAKEYIHDDNFYLDYFELFKRDGELRFERATQGLFGLKKKRLSRYFFDCPDLVAKINNNRITTALDVVRYYNQFCVEQ